MIEELFVKPIINFTGQQKRTFITGEQNKEILKPNYFKRRTKV